MRQVRPVSSTKSAAVDNVEPPITESTEKVYIRKTKIAQEMPDKILFSNSIENSRPCTMQFSISERIFLAHFTLMISLIKNNTDTTLNLFQSSMKTPPNVRPSILTSSIVPSSIPCLPIYPPTKNPNQPTPSPTSTVPQRQRQQPPK